MVQRHRSGSPVCYWTNDSEDWGMVCRSVAGVYRAGGGRVSAATDSGWWSTGHTVSGTLRLRSERQDAREGVTVTQKLTVKQAGFRDDLATCTQRQAYINNYDTYGMSAAVIDVEASRLAANPKISLSVIAAQEKQRDWTLATVLQDCDTNLAGARANNQWSAANAIVTTGAKVAGILTDRVDLNVTHTIKPGLSLEELEARIQRLDALEAGVVDSTGVVED